MMPPTAARRELPRIHLPRTRVDRGKRNVEAASILFAPLACDKDPHLCVMRRLLRCATVVTNTLLCAAMGKGVAMKRFTTEGTNDQEGLGLIPAQRRAEEVPPLGLSFDGGVAGARRYSRRQALGLLGGSLAGLTLLSPAKSQAATSPVPPFRNFDHITLECQSQVQGPKFLDGRTADGTVGLAPNTNPPFTGTRWEAVKVLGTENTFWFFCRANWPRPAGAPYYEPGPRWLDGRTGNSTVGLAPSRGAQFTGTKWEVIPYGADRIALKCLGTIPGNRYLIGRPSNSQDRRVGLTRYTGNVNTLWKVAILPK
jgi:hypothetical protein